MFISVRSLKDNLSVLEKSKCVSDKLMDYTLKMQNIYIFSYAQECWTFILLKNTKIKIRGEKQKTNKHKKKDTHNPE